MVVVANSNAGSGRNWWKRSHLLTVIGPSAENLFGSREETKGRSLPENSGLGVEATGLIAAGKLQKRSQ